MSEHGSSVALNERQSDFLKEIGTDHIHMVKELAVSRGHCHRARHKMNSGLHFRNLRLHRIRHRESRVVDPHRWLARDTEAQLDAINVLRTRNPFVVRDLVAQKQHDKNRADKTDRQASHIDKAIKFVAEEIPECGDQIIAEHGLTPVAEWSHAHVKKWAIRE